MFYSTCIQNAKPLILPQPFLISLLHNQFNSLSRRQMEKKRVDLTPFFNW